MKYDKDPLITIITVTRNVSSTLGDTIESILGQTYKNIEYIIIDGASTDGTVGILKKYDDKLSHWISEKDAGLYDAMNKGIDMAKGDWINFMNAGDTFVDKDVVQKFVDEMNEESDICYGSRIVVDNGKKTLQETKPLKDIYSIMPFGHQAAFIRKELLQKYHFDLSYSLSSDYAFFLRCYREDNVFQELSFTICHFDRNGLSTTQQLRSVIETVKLLSGYISEEELRNTSFFKTLLRISCPNNTKNETALKLLQSKTESSKAVSESELQETREQLNTLNASIRYTKDISIFKNPLKKLKAYKNILHVYHSVSK